MGAGNFDNWRDYIRTGKYTQRHTKHPEGVVRCLNCGTEFHGSYCPECGQYWEVKRISWRSVVDGLLQGLTGFQANLPRTLLDLFYRPGYLVADYLKGRRKNYTNPFSLILLLAAFFVIIEQYVSRNDIRSVTAGFGNTIGSAFGGSQESMDAEAQAKTLEATQEISNIIYDNFGLFNLALIPLLTLPIWIVYRKQGSWKKDHQNLFESVTIAAYITAQNVCVSIIILPFETSENIGALTVIGYFITIPLMLLTLWQLYGMSVKTYLLRLLLLGVTFAAFLLLASVLFAVGTSVGYMLTH